MCFDKETSIVTYLIGTISSIALFKSNNTSYKIAGQFFLFVSQMQLIEYLLWKDTSCNTNNKIISTTGSLLNHLQPIVLYLLLKLNNKSLSNNKLLSAIIGIYIISLVLYSNNIYPLDCTTLTDTEPQHLDWKWNHKKHSTKFYLIFLVTMILLSYNGFEKPYNLYLALICIGTYVVSYIIYKDKNVTGAVWCWFAALIPFLLLIFDNI
jgi:hypothetical protein